MFPLKVRRKYVRIEPKIQANIKTNNYELNGEIIDLSASGCTIITKFDDVAELKEKVIITFMFKDVEFIFAAKCVRKHAYTFVDVSKEMQDKLNKLIIEEYFKETPELCEK